jgi:hypothetical protein
MTDATDATDPETLDQHGRPDPKPAHGRSFVPEHFEVPSPPRTDRFWLEPLGPQHNEADYAAWTSSMDHIAATPGFDDGWPHEMTLAANLGDLVMHARHFDEQLGFTYTVRDTGDDDVIGCVYIYPSRHDATIDAKVTSWVRASHAEYDGVVVDVVQQWLAADWPFANVKYR